MVMANPHMVTPGSGLCYGPKQPTGKGKRLIIAHIGSKDGFLPDALLMFESKKTGDYHEDMDGERFENWLRNVVLPKLNPGDAVVMDNASYHSVLVQKAPTSASKREEMIHWLKQYKLHYEEHEDGNKIKKGDLYKRYIKPFRNHPQYKKFRIDELAKSKGVTVIRLPPYHCCLNPIELVWAALKWSVRKNNITHRLEEVKALLHEAIAKFTPDKWNKCVMHVEKKVEKYLTEEEILSKASRVDPLIIPLDDDDDSKSSSDEEEEAAWFTPATAEDILAEDLSLDQLLVETDEVTFENLPSFLSSALDC